MNTHFIETNDTQIIIRQRTDEYSSKTVALFTRENSLVAIICLEALNRKWRANDK